MSVNSVQPTTANPTLVERFKKQPVAAQVAEVAVPVVAVATTAIAASRGKTVLQATGKETGFFASIAEGFKSIFTKKGREAFAGAKEKAEKLAGLSDEARSAVEKAEAKKEKAEGTLTKAKEKVTKLRDQHAYAVAAEDLAAKKGTPNEKAAQDALDKTKIGKAIKKADEKLANAQGEYYLAGGDKSKLPSGYDLKQVPDAVKNKGGKARTRATGSSVDDDKVAKWADAMKEAKKASETAHKAVATKGGKPVAAADLEKSLDNAQKRVKNLKATIKKAEKVIKNGGKELNTAA